MKIININLFDNGTYNCDGIIIGKTLENDATTLIINLTDELATKDFFIEFEKPDNEKVTTYKLNPVNNKIEYEIPNSLLDKQGILKVEFVLRKDDQVWKSYNLIFTILESINASDEIPDKFPDFVTEATKVLDHIILNGEGDKFLSDDGTYKKVEGSGGTSDYTQLENKPSINNVELNGNKTLDELNIQEKGNYASQEEVDQNKTDISKINDNMINYSLITETGSKIDLNIDTTTYIMTLKLLDKNDNELSSGKVDLPIESMIINVTYKDKMLTFTLQNGQTIDVPLDDLISGLVTEDTFNQALNLKADKTEIPTKVSQLENDKDYLITEKDPTVPEYVKAITTLDINNWNTKEVHYHINSSDTIYTLDELEKGLHIFEPNEVVKIKMETAFDYTPIYCVNSLFVQANFNTLEDGALFAVGTYYNGLEINMETDERTYKDYGTYEWYKNGENIKTSRFYADGDGDVALLKGDSNIFKKLPQCSKEPENDDDLVNKKYISTTLKSFPQELVDNGFEYKKESGDVAYTYKFVNVSDTGFSYDESNNKYIAGDGSYSLCKITFNTTTETTINITGLLDPYNSDKAIFSNFDNELLNSDQTDEAILMGEIKQVISDMGNYSVEYTLPVGEHFIEIKFRRENASSSFNFSIPKSESATTTTIEKMATQSYVDEKTSGNGYTIIEGNYDKWSRFFQMSAAKDEYDENSTITFGDDGYLKMSEADFVQLLNNIDRTSPFTMYIKFYSSTLKATYYIPFELTDMPGDEGTLTYRFNFACPRDKYALYSLSNHNFTPGNIQMLLLFQTSKQSTTFNTKDYYYELDNRIRISSNTNISIDYNETGPTGLIQKKDFESKTSELEKNIKGENAKALKSFPQELVDTGFDYDTGEKQQVTISYTVENISDKGFKLNDNQFYESTCQGVSNGYSLCKVIFNNQQKLTFNISYINSGESDFDYGIFGNVDQDFSNDNSDEGATDTTKVKLNCKGQSSVDTKELEYTIPAGEHYVYIKYRKDGGSDQGNDSLQFKIPATIATAVIVNEKMATQSYVDKTHYENITGYNSSKTQVLKNINGTLTWVDEA